MINVSAIRNTTSSEATILTRNLIYEIDKLGKRYSEEGKKDWAVDALEILDFTVGAGEGLSLGMAHVLYLFREHWDDLDLNFREKYDYQFNILVTRHTPIRPETYDNYARAVETYLIKGAKPFGTLQVPKRDKFKKEVVVDGEVVREEVEWDPMKVPLPKLALMRASVERNEMTPDRWAMMMDSGVTHAQLQAELYRRETPSAPDPSMKFRLEGDILVVSEFGEEAVIGKLDFYEFNENELVTNAIKHLLRCLSIKMDEEIIQLIKDHGFTERLNSNDSHETKDQSQGE